jgi:hypothetical protein
MSREAEIYGAVIRQLVTVDHTFGGGDPGYRVIYVLDRAFPEAADPLDVDGDGTTIRADVQEATREAVTGLPPVRFVPSRVEVAGPLEDPRGVMNHGVLIMLGPIPEGEDRVEVGASLYIGPVAGIWLTYVVELRSDAWRITGTTGSSAIS